MNWPKFKSKDAASVNMAEREWRRTLGIIVEDCAVGAHYYSSAYRLVDLVNRFEQFREPISQLIDGPPEAFIDATLGWTVNKQAHDYVLALRSSEQSRDWIALLQKEAKFILKETYAEAAV